MSFSYADEQMTLSNLLGVNCMYNYNNPNTLCSNYVSSPMLNMTGGLGYDTFGGYGYGGIYGLSPKEMKRLGNMTQEERLKEQNRLYDLNQMAYMERLQKQFATNMTFQDKRAQQQLDYTRTNEQRIIDYQKPDKAIAQAVSNLQNAIKMNRKDQLAMYMEALWSTIKAHPKYKNLDEDALRQVAKDEYTKYTSSTVELDTFANNAGPFWQALKRGATWNFLCDKEDQVSATDKWNGMAGDRSDNAKRVVGNAIGVTATSAVAGAGLAKLGEKICTTKGIMKNFKGAGKFGAIAGVIVGGAVAIANS